MESTKPVRRYTDLEKAELIEQWKQSGKSRGKFCAEQGISHHSLNSWIYKNKRRKPSLKPGSSFVPLKVNSQEGSIFIQMILNNGVKINVFKQVEASFIAALIKS